MQIIVKGYLKHISPSVAQPYCTCIFISHIIIQALRPKQNSPSHKHYHKKKIQDLGVLKPDLPADQDNSGRYESTLSDMGSQSLAGVPYEMYFPRICSFRRLQEGLVQILISTSQNLTFPQEYYSLLGISSMLQKGSRFLP